MSPRAEDFSRPHVNLLNTYLGRRHSPKMQLMFEDVAHMSRRPISKDSAGNGRHASDGGNRLFFRENNPLLQRLGQRDRQDGYRQCGLKPYLHDEYSWSSAPHGLVATSQ